jgi:diguanylate cyclase (GGDEF)-like protein
VRKSDTVARMGGDEFVVLLPDMKDPENAEGIAKKLVAALSAPVSFQSREVPVSVSVGVCTVAGDELDGDALLTHVDAAMYEAKEHGRNRYQVYRPEFVQARA